MRVGVLEDVEVLLARRELNMVDSSSMEVVIERLRGRVELREEASSELVRRTEEEREEAMERVIEASVEVEGMDVASAEMVEKSSPLDDSDETTASAATSEGLDLALLMPKPTPTPTATTTRRATSAHTSRFLLFFVSFSSSGGIECTSYPPFHFSSSSIAYTGSLKRRGGLERGAGAGCKWNACGGCDEGRGRTT